MSSFLSFQCPTLLDWGNNCLGPHHAEDFQSPAFFYCLDDVKEGESDRSSNMRQLISTPWLTPITVKAWHQYRWSKTGWSQIPKMYALKNQWFWERSSFRSAHHQIYIPRRLRNLYALEVHFASIQRGLGMRLQNLKQRKGTDLPCG